METQKQLCIGNTLGLGCGDVLGVSALIEVAPSSTCPSFWRSCFGMG